MLHKAISVLPIVKVCPQGSFEVTDNLAAEEPLEMRLAYTEDGEPVIKNVSVTMRTPGNDAELAIGFLFTEGIITAATDVAANGYQFSACSENRENVIKVTLADGVSPNLKNADRNFYTTSSCGVCGKGAINAIRTVGTQHKQVDENFITADMLLQLPGILNNHQEIFANTGGLHASALFTRNGKLLILREDVGRHNALDKVIGDALQQDLLPLNNHVLLLSGRASFELVQKAVMAGINIIAAVGAPSTLAVQLAQEFNVTLIGFLREERFNIYNGAQRVRQKELV